MNMSPSGPGVMMVSFGIAPLPPRGLRFIFGSFETASRKLFESTLTNDIPPRLVNPHSGEPLFDVRMLFGGVQAPGTIAPPDKELSLSLELQKHRFL